MAIITGLSGDFEFGDVDAFSQLGEGGQAKFIILNASDDWAAVKALHGAALTIKCSKYSQKRFHGEVRKITAIGDTAHIELDEAGRKAFSQRCAYNPIVTAGTVGATARDELTDHEGNFGAVAENMILHCEKNDTNLFEFKVYPYIGYILDESLDPFVPDAEEGHVRNLCYYDTGAAASVAEWAAKEEQDDAEDPSFYLIPYFQIYIKSGGSITAASLETIIQAFHNGRYATNTPTLEVWDYVGAEYEEIRDYEGDLDSGAADTDCFGYPAGVLSKDISKTNPFSAAEIAKYFEPVGSTNSSGYDMYLFRLRIWTGIADEEGVWKALLHLHRIQLSITTDAERSAVRNVAPIAATDSDWVQVYDDVDWTVLDFPASDGIDRGDMYTILQNISTIIAGIIANSELTFGVDNYAETDGIPFAVDTSDMSIGDFFKQYTAAVNGAWWHNAVSGNYEIRDAFVSSGVVLTWLDINGYLSGNFSYEEDSRNLRTKLIVIGSKDHYRYSEDVEGSLYPLELGDEEEIITDPELTSYRDCEVHGVNRLTRHINPDVAFQGVISLTGAPQSYAGLALGKTVALRLPTAANPDLTDNGGVDELLIRGIKYVDKDGAESLELTLQRRHPTPIFADGFGDAEISSDWTVDDNAYLSVVEENGYVTADRLITPYDTTKTTALVLELTSDIYNSPFVVEAEIDFSGYDGDDPEGAGPTHGRVSLFGRLTYEEASPQVRGCVLDYANDTDVGMQSHIHPNSNDDNIGPVSGTMLVRMHVDNPNTTVKVEVFHDGELKTTISSTEVSEEIHDVGVEWIQTFAEGQDPVTSAKLNYFRVLPWGGNL